MAEAKRVIQCPTCRFANRLGEARCLICKTELPQTLPAPGAKEPAAEPPRGPAPATNTAAAARASAAAASAAAGGVVRRLIDPTKPQDETQPTKRPDNVTTMRRAIDPSLLAAAAAPAPEPVADPPRPHTRRLPKQPAPADVVAWLWCDPLPPIPLSAGKQVIVGRQDTCDLCLPHKEVSRAHAVFRVSGRQISLEDQGSSNGCYLNGKRAANAIVKVGDMIQIGPYEIELRAAGDDGAVQASDTKSFELTSLNSGSPGASMTGRLSEVPLVEILQSIEFNHKTCTLAISDGRLKGRIVFGDGRPMTATFGGERDLEAVRAMLALKDGRFVLSNEIEADEQTMHQTITALLLDAARGQDEAGVAAEPAAVSAYESNAYQINPDLAKTAESEPAPGDAPTDQAAPLPEEPPAESQ